MPCVLVQLKSTVLLHLDGTSNIAEDIGRQVSMGSCFQFAIPPQQFHAVLYSLQTFRNRYRFPICV